jgi:hypothetical protein
MRFSIKYLALFCMCLVLSGCGATGKLLGNVTMLPVRAAGSIVRAASYQDGTGIPATDISIYNMGDAIPMHNIE